MRGITQTFSAWGFGGNAVVTLKDIARLAGVSPMTVSRVVNGQYNKVSEETVERVQRIIREHNYVPNSSARSLASKSTRLIAIIIQGEDNALEYPYNALMAGNLCRFVQDRGYSPLLYYVKDYREITRRLRTWNVEGAVFLGMFDEDMRNIQEDNRIPLVFTDSYSAMRQVTNVGLDDFKGGELAGRYLMEMGHRAIAFVGASTEQSSIVRQRLNGLRAALSQAGLTLPDERVIFEDDFRNALRAMFEGTACPTALFVAADIEAARVMDYLRELGVRVPEDCSIVGFDNLYVSAFTAPRLTTIAQDIPRKAQIACELLFRRIESSDTPADNIILDVKLVERESVRRVGT